MIVARGRWWGAAVIVGAFLLGVATLLHPWITHPLVQISDVEQAAHHQGWNADHIIMMLALLLWIGGLVGLGTGRKSTGDRVQFSTIAHGVSFFLSAALAIWLVILAAELTVMPLLFLRMQADVLYTHLAQAWLSFSLLAGYLAMALIWGGCFLLAKSLGKRWGERAALWGLLGILAGLASPGGSLVILAVTQPAPFAWTIYTGWRYWRENE